jgi:hypothetical protein
LASGEFSIPPDKYPGPVFLSVVRVIHCTGAAHHRVGDECLVLLNHKKYRMFHEDGTPERAFKAGVTMAFCQCGARWDYHSGGRASTRDQHFE